MPDGKLSYSEGPHGVDSISVGRPPALATALPRRSVRWGAASVSPEAAAPEIAGMSLCAVASVRGHDAHHALPGRNTVSAPLLAAARSLDGATAIVQGMATGRQSVSTGQA